MNTLSPDNGAKVPSLELKDAWVGSLKNSDEPLVEDVNWTISEGDFWIVGGLSSSGKSDLLATAAGIVRPLKGQLHLFGRNTAELTEDEYLRERLRVGLVFGDGGRLFPDMTVAANVALAHSYHHDCSFQDSEPHVRRILEVLGLDAFYNAPAAKIHRPWRQRVALARCMALSPEVLLLDDPINGLDPRQCAWWLDCLQKMASGKWMEGVKPVTMAVATDNLTPWRQIGTQFAILKQRRWLTLGDSHALETASDPLLSELLAARDTEL
jgi:ABC-type transporter Mla maintaining outer membrane lipid asymmetry ATPase subunit MlaF